MSVQRSPGPFIPRTRSAYASRMTVLAVPALDHIPTRVFPEGGDTGKIATERTGRFEDPFARGEIVAPGVVIDRLTLCHGLGGSSRNPRCTCGMVLRTYNGE